MIEEQEKYPEGHFISKWMGICMIIFSTMFLPLCIATDNMGFMSLGPAIGVSVGIAIGSGIEQKQRKLGMIRSKTKKEIKNTKLAILFGFVTLSFGAVVLLTIIFI